MKKVYVFQTLIGVAVMLAMTAAMAQHVPIPDVSACPAACNGTDPNVCCMVPMPGEPGDGCWSDPLVPCPVIWPLAPFAGMPTWDMEILAEYDGTTFNILAINELQPFGVDLPTPGTYDFCAWTDQLFCTLGPIGSALGVPEVTDFANIVQCINMDINGELDTCKDIPVQSNGIPDRFELAILAAVLNDTGHPLHAEAVAAMQTNMDALCSLLITALSSVEIGGAPIDARLLIYQLAPWLIPSLGGVLSAFAATGDTLTTAALDEMLGLLEDIGIAPPAGGITAITDAVPAVGQAGDISGNGFTNREIYEWFVQVNPAMTVAEYVALALDPATIVPAKVAIAGGGNASVGDEVTLTVNLTNPATGYSAAAYTWYKWEVTGQDAELCDIYDWVVIPAETGSTLVLASAQLADSGKYACDVEMDDGTKAPTGNTIMASTTLVVADTPTGVPVGGALGLTLLAGACALAGAVGIRRRK